MDTMDSGPHDPTVGDEPTAADEPVGPAAFPPLPSRLLAVFMSPGRLMDQLAADPKWVGALLVSALVVGVSMVLIPVDLFMEAQRQAVLERGGELSDVPETVEQAMRIVIPAGAVLSSLLFSFIFAGIYTFIFAFVLGDEGRYKQYLAVLSHAWFIAAVFGLAVTPLRISTGDPQFTLNLASFFYFLPDGYFLNVLRVLDLTQVWSTLVIAQGAHAIDARRSFGSAAAILLAIFLGVAMIAARFV